MLYLNKQLTLQEMFYVGCRVTALRVRSCFMLSVKLPLFESLLALC